MNKKGFTLVEMLASIVILSILLVLSYPAIRDVFNNGKEGISELNKKQIEDAAKIIVNEVIYCNMSDETKKILNVNEEDTKNVCKQALDKLVSGVNINVSDLSLSEKSSKCTGIINIKVSEDTYKETIGNIENVECK